MWVQPRRLWENAQAMTPMNEAMEILGNILVEEIKINGDVIKAKKLGNQGRSVVMTVMRKAFRM